MDRRGPGAVEAAFADEPAAVEPACGRARGDARPAAIEAAAIEPAPVEPDVDAQVAAAGTEPERNVVADVAKTVVAAEILSAATDDDPIAAATRSGQARTSDLLTRFRPGQNIDAELAAFEARSAGAGGGRPARARVGRPGGRCRGRRVRP